MEITFAICVKFSSLPSHLSRMFVSFASVCIVQKTCVSMVQSVWNCSFQWFKAFGIVCFDRSKRLVFLVSNISSVSEGVNNYVVQIFCMSRQQLLGK